MVKINIKKPNSRTMRRLIVFGVVLLVALCVLIYIKIAYEITSVSITGNDHYSEREIEKIVFEDSHDYNSVILYLKYNNKSIENVPFIERIDVDIVNPNKVRINVYEKALAGYVEYLGHYMYFDKDGIVVESSNQTMEDVPFVTGLKYDHVVLHEPLPVKNKNVFMQILNITQLLNKYEIRTDRIAFDSNGDVTLYFGDARVSLGNDDYIDEKINEMHLLLPKLEGLKGTLHMENYSGEDTNFSFDMDKEEMTLEEENAEATSEENGEEGQEEENL